MQANTATTPARTAAKIKTGTRDSLARRAGAVAGGGAEMEAREGGAEVAIWATPVAFGDWGEIGAGPPELTVFVVLPQLGQIVIPPAA